MIEDTKNKIIKFCKRHKIRPMRLLEYTSSYLGEQSPKEGIDYIVKEELYPDFRDNDNMNILLDILEESGSAKLIEGLMKAPFHYRLKTK